METLSTEVLVVGGGTGGTIAAIQAAKAGARTVLVSEFPWLGGMLTSAGVSAVDGHELAAWQTGAWGKFLRELQARQPGGLDHGWVSLFTFDPRVGAAIFQEWVKQTSNLNWLVGQVPQGVLRRGDRIVGVEFQDYQIQAQITIDGTELGDLLVLGDIPHWWGWELHGQWGEPSAPVKLADWMQKYPVQAATWVTVMKRMKRAEARSLRLENLDPDPRFANAWQQHGAEAFLGYGGLPGKLVMLNWPIAGNDYSEGIDRLIGGAEARREFQRECWQHSQGFADYVQQYLGYGLAEGVFPRREAGFALHPYYRESRRLRGLVTIREQDILPQGRVAPLPRDRGGAVTTIAIGNYANDHHYPGQQLSLQPKTIKWGGRLTGTPFGIPYGALVPGGIDGFLVCEKNISVSHIANGATRLQPAVMLIGQAAGMAAALCIDQQLMPRDLPVRELQMALLQGQRTIAPSALVPFYNLQPQEPSWLDHQKYYLEHPENYPTTGEVTDSLVYPEVDDSEEWVGEFQRRGEQDYQITITKETWKLITELPKVERSLQSYRNGQILRIQGRLNHSGKWLVVTRCQGN